MLDTVIFDMDGLLIDSEPQWQLAGKETLHEFGISLTQEQYFSSTGLRTPEWIEYWFTHFRIDIVHAAEAIHTIEQRAIHNIRENAVAFPGTHYIIKFFKEKKFRMGLATSSPLRLVKVVTEKLGIIDVFDAVSSAEDLPHGKPHPQVYLNCASQLNVSPLQCICFEDSFNGLISAKAARMKCVVVPVKQQQKDRKWYAADLQLPSLLKFNDILLSGL
ncbi:MAG: hexitol phosphatase HxpB [Chitinophagaceae bacterium]